MTAALKIGMTLHLILAAVVQLRQVEQGRRAWLALPADAPLSHLEQNDARTSAQGAIPLALLGLTAAGMLWLSRNPTAPRLSKTSTWSWTLALFWIALLADLATTVWFMHVRGIDAEAHPAIRLFAYAYGRTMGPVLAKLIQGFGLLWLTRPWPVWKDRCRLAAALFCAIAAMHNARLTLL